METRKVTWWNVLGYACLNFLGGGTQALSSAFLMLFYTMYCDIPAVQAGLIFTIARCIDDWYGLRVYERFQTYDN
jgi:oligogalacturonide transporter